MSGNLVEVSVPMPTPAAEQRAQAALDAAQSLVIATPEQYETGAEQLKAIKAKAREIDEARKSLKRPIDEAAARIQAFFKPPLEFLSQAEGIVKSKLTAYQQEQERIRREEQRKAEDAARKERERLERQRLAAEAKAREKEAELRRQAAEADAAERAKIEAKMRAEAEKAAAKQAELEQREAAVTAPVIHREAPKVAGISTRTVYKFRIKDPAAIPREYLAVDEAKIRKVVQALKADANIPGVEVYAEEQMASRAASF